MTEAEPDTTDADLRPDYENAEVAEQIQAQHLQNEQQQREELSQAERKKRQLMAARRSETSEVEVTFGPEGQEVSHPIEFRTLDGSVKDLLEEIGIRMGTESEDEAFEKMQENGEDYLEKREDLAAILDDHAIDDAWDEEFFETEFGGGERLGLLGDIEDAEDSGN